MLVLSNRSILPDDLHGFIWTSGLSPWFYLDLWSVSMVLSGPLVCLHGFIRTSGLSPWFYLDIWSVSMFFSGPLVCLHGFIWTYGMSPWFYLDLWSVSMVLSGPLVCLHGFIWIAGLSPWFYLDLWSISMILSGPLVYLHDFIWTSGLSPWFYLDLWSVSMVLSGSLVCLHASSAIVSLFHKTVRLSDHNAFLILLCLFDRPSVIIITILFKVLSISSLISSEKTSYSLSTVFCVNVLDQVWTYVWHGKKGIPFLT